MFNAIPNDDGSSDPKWQELGADDRPPVFIEVIRKTDKRCKEMGLATPPCDDMVRHPTSCEELENGTANAPVASPPSLRATCNFTLLLSPQVSRPPFPYYSLASIFRHELCFHELCHSSSWCLCAHWQHRHLTPGIRPTARCH